jgi:hypothetical protein
MTDDVPTAEGGLARARARADRAAARSVELYDLLERLRAAQADTLPAGPEILSPPSNRVEAVTAQRRVAQLEQMAAATHERAAELYESWLKHHSGAPLAARELARQHRGIAGANRSVERLAERTLTGFEARLDAGASAGADKGLVALAALDRLRVMVSRRVDETVEACRREGATWEDIGCALHVTRQTAHQRYRRRAE